MQRESRIGNNDDVPQRTINDYNAKLELHRRAGTRAVQRNWDESKSREASLAGWRI